MKTSGVANAICVGDQFGDEGRPEILDPGPSHLLDEGDPVVIGIPENDRRKHRKRDQPAEIEPWRHSQCRSFGTAISQIRIAGPKNSAVYFDSSAAPAAAPTASHHAPRPVSSTFASAKNSKTRGDQQRRVGRHDQRADRRHQRDVEQDRRGRRHAPAAEQDLRGRDRSPSSSAARAGSRPAARRARYRPRSACRARITSATIGGWS